MGAITERENPKEETKMVGGQIPISLYWEFKRVQAARKETATQALENAIRLYLDDATTTACEEGI